MLLWVSPEWGRTFAAWTSSGETRWTQLCRRSDPRKHPAPFSAAPFLKSRKKCSKFTILVVRLKYTTRLQTKNKEYKSYKSTGPFTNLEFNSPNYVKFLNPIARRTCNPVFKQSTIIGYGLHIDHICSSFVYPGYILTEHLTCFSESTFLKSTKLVDWRFLNLQKVQSGFIFTLLFERASGFWLVILHQGNIQVL